MIMKNHRVLYLLLVLILSACSAGNSDGLQPTAEGGADHSTSAVEIGEHAIIEAADLDYPAEWPQALEVIITGSLPDGCTHISDIVQTRTPNKIILHVRTSRPVDTACTEALVPFSTTAVIDLSGFEVGAYQVEIYGRALDFELDEYSEPENQGG